MNLQKAKLIKKNQLTKDVVEFHFECEKKFSYKAGQFITIKINDEKKEPCFRAYSIASAPRKNHKNFELIVKIIKDGRASQWFKNLEEGSTIDFLGPNGKFFLNHENEKNLIFIATGTGVAPLKAMIEELLEKKSPKKITLIFGLRHEKNKFYHKYFSKLAKQNSNFTFELTLSQPENEWDGNEGRVTNFIRHDLKNYQNSEFYICGLKAMVDEVTDLLLENGVKQENIIFEKYD